MSRQLVFLRNVSGSLVLRTKIVYHVLPRWAWLGIASVVIVGTLCGFQNYRADAELHASQKLDSAGRYAQAKKGLSAISQFAVFATIRKGIHTEEQRNQQLTVVAQKLAEAEQLLKAHDTQAAEKVLKSIGTGLNGSPNVQSQVDQLQKSAQSQATVSNKNQGGTSSPKQSTGGGSGGSASGGSGTSTGTGGTSGGSGGTPPLPGPMTSLSVNSFTANATAGTASTCNITDALVFSADGTGSVTTTWSLFSAKSSSETNNPTTFTFSAAGSKSDSFGFSSTQGLESGDAYRVSVTITSTTNPAITTTAGPISLNTCAAPPALAAEQQPATMSVITPSTPSVYQYHDNIFPNECSVQVTTPYSVNASGTVEAIVMVTSGSSIGYTYYDKNGATGFTGPGSTSDTSYFRLPHLPGGGSYSILVKLVEVSSPGTIYATTSTITSGCS